LVGRENPSPPRSYRSAVSELSARPKLSAEREAAVRAALAAGTGIRRTAAEMRGLTSIHALRPGSFLRLRSVASRHVKPFHVDVQIASLREGVNIMKSSIGAFVLRLAAMAVLLAPAAAQAQGSSRTICKGYGTRVCDTVYSPPPPPPEPPKHTTGTETLIPYDPVAEARKAQLRATEHRAPSSSTLCPPPYRMTASDGCQK
jgi:hypothetical protein